MKVYFNPCFNKSISFERAEKKMPQKQKNFSQSSETESCAGEPSHKLNGGREYEDDEVIYSNQPNVQIDKRRRRRFVCMLFCGLLVFILAIAFTVIAVRAFNVKRHNNGAICLGVPCRNITFTTKKETLLQDVCESDECVKIAESISASMNTTVDPCENFNDFVCGRWHENNPLPDSEGGIFPLKILTVRKDEHLKQVIENQKQPQGFKKKVVDFYKSCMNVAKVDAQGKEPLLSFIASFGGWSPIKTQTERTSLDLTTLLIRTHEYFTFSVYTDQLYSPLFKAYVTSNSQDSTKHIAEFSPPNLPVRVEAFLSNDSSVNKTLEKYRQMQLNYVALLGPKDQAESILSTLMEFERSVAKLINSADYNSVIIISVQDFINEVSKKIEWLRFLQSMFRGLNVVMTKEIIISARSIGYFKQLDKLLENTPETVIRDYIIWLWVWRFGSYASAPFQEADYIFKKAVTGMETRPHRWKKCLTDLEQTMEFALASLYVEKTLTKEDIDLTSQIVENVRKEFKNNLVTLEWMDVNTKATAFKKVDLMKSNIGYPEFVKDDKAVDKFYQRLSINEATYFENILAMYKDKRLVNLRLINKTVDSKTYDTPPTLAEAFYNKQKNKMTFLAGMLQPPLCNIGVPAALNYGSMGLIAGHEITHAFDDSGKDFNERGEQRDWWSESSKNAYNDKKACVKTQYSRYKINDMSIDGEWTLSENIADNGGVKVAFMAYKEWLKQSRDKRLPNLSYTPEQLFFISQGQVWCGTYRVKYMEDMLKNDPHSPNKFRTIGSLSNLEEFSTVFKCQPGSPMNPVKKCRVW